MHPSRCVAMIVATSAIIAAACGESRSPAPAATASADARAAASLDGSTMCDSIGVVMGAMSDPRRIIARDTTLREPLQDTPDWRRGCLLSFADSTGNTRDDDVLEAWLRERGWVSAPAYSADGADGTVFAFAGHGTLCVFRGSWDGGDDSDTSYKPKPGSAWLIGCAPSTAADTARS